MDIKQIYPLVNTATQETLGESAVVAEDLSNLVDIGEQIFNANAVDRFVRSLVNHIGKVVFVNRVYAGSAPSVLMDGWEYGSIMEKIRVDLPEATENESWELVDGASYDPNIFRKPKVSAKFFNKRVTFEVDISITEMQVKQSFSNGTQLNAFVSMIFNAVENSMTLKIDSLVHRTINNFTAETLHNAFNNGDYGSGSGVRAINLLHLYNQRYPNNTITAAQAITTPEFVRFMSMTLANYQKRLATFSKLFNIGGTAKFTPADRLHVVMLSDVMSAAGAYLQSDTFHEQFTALPKAETVAFWQGSGQNYNFNEVSSIHVNTASGHEVVASGILCVMFDRDALGVTNMDRRVRTNYNGKAEFMNYFYKYDAGYFNDLDENFLVFYVADDEEI